MFFDNICVVFPIAISQFTILATEPQHQFLHLPAFLHPGGGLLQRKHYVETNTGSLQNFYIVFVLLLKLLTCSELCKDYYCLETFFI